MESQLVAEAETTVARWVTSAGGDMQVVDEVPHPAHSQEALGPGRRLEDDRGMRRIELQLAPLLLFPSCTEKKVSQFCQCLLCTLVDRFGQ